MSRCHDGPSIPGLPATPDVMIRQYRYIKTWIKSLFSNVDPLVMLKKSNTLFHNEINGMGN